MVELFQHFQIYLPVTVAPSSALDVLSPSFKIFFNTLPSPVTSITGLKDTNSISMFSTEVGGIEWKPLFASLPWSPKASAIIYHLSELVLFFIFARTFNANHDPYKMFLIIIPPSLLEMSSTSNWTTAFTVAATDTRGQCDPFSFRLVWSFRLWALSWMFQWTQNWD